LVCLGEIGECFLFYSNQDPSNIRNGLAMGCGVLLDIGCYAGFVRKISLAKGSETREFPIPFNRLGQLAFLKTDVRRWN
jgi:hypothetical protein